MGNPEELEPIEEDLDETEGQIVADAVNNMLEIFSAVPPEFRKAVLRHVTRIAQKILNEGR